MKLTAKQITLFQYLIFDWWKVHKRDLPWRHTHDPYKIMVSEVMLQQTQVRRVIPKYTEFIEAYPTVNALAKASTSDVLKTWKGMGYNRRALYLKQAARAVVEQYGGKFPKSEKELVKLPGLGIYTARALLVFAYRQNVACVDTNIRQIITHFFLAGKTKGPAFEAFQGRVLEKQIESIARQLLPSGKSWEWHQALMDYGALALPALRNSAIHCAPALTHKKSIPFKDSNRFYRGRIIDRLREAAQKKDKLTSTMIVTYGKDKGYYEHMLRSLQKDGLIEITRNTISLPR